jgi:hypothetical protein
MFFAFVLAASIPPVVIAWLAPFRTQGAASEMPI